MTLSDFQNWRCVSCSNSSGEVDQYPDEGEIIDGCMWKCPECCQSSDGDSLEDLVEVIEGSFTKEVLMELHESGYTLEDVAKELG